jgi:molybdopterin-guanine dinucleotide biosynthesis protein A
VNLSFPLSGVIIADAGRIHITDDAGTGLSDILAALSPLCDDIVIVAADPSAFLVFDALIVTDHYSPAGLWSGVHAGLFAARHPHAFITACGLPVANPALVDMFVGAAGPRYDAVLPDSAQTPLPLPGIYGKTCLKPLGSQLAEGDSTGNGWLRRIRICTLT